MSHYDYEQSRDIEGCAFPFYALIMAAMRQADSDNVEKLKAAFPETWDELSARYHAPGGLLNGDTGTTTLRELSREATDD